LASDRAASAGARLEHPALVITHIAGVRLGQTLFGHEKLYPQVFFAYWIVWPYKMWLMYAVMIVAWIHGCIGLHFWLRMKAFYRRAAPFLLAAAVLVPTLALLGLYQGGRSVVDSDSAEWRAENLRHARLAREPASRAAEHRDDFLIGYLALLALALLARGARAVNERRVGMIHLSYGNGRTVRVPKGLSVLEASLRHNVPHASVCGGRARCSTCRIRIIGDTSELPEPRSARPSCWPGSVRPTLRYALPAVAAENRSLVLSAVLAARGFGRQPCP